MTKVYFTNDKRKDGYGEIFQTKAKDAHDTISKAISEWERLTASEKKQRKITAEVMTIADEYYSEDLEPMEIMEEHFWDCSTVVLWSSEEQGLNEAVKEMKEANDFTGEEANAIRRLYLAKEGAYNDYSLIKEIDWEHDYLTYNDGRDGESYFSYVDEHECIAVRVSDLEVIKDEKTFEDLLC